MSKEIFSGCQVYKFLKVEEYFARYQEWDKLEKVISHFFSKEKKSLDIQFNRVDGQKCLMVIQFPQNDVMRVRFNPTKSIESEYQGLTRLVEMSEFDQTDPELSRNTAFDVDCKQGNNELVLTTNSEFNTIVMKVAIALDPFGIKVFNNSESNSQFAEIPVWQTAEPWIYYTANGSEDYAIIQAVKKPDTAKYIGFGEQGGKKLSHNINQFNYFNFDNMRYRQVYNKGPLDEREPLYHSEPFFYEFNGIPGSNNVNAIMIDNPSQVLIDIGYSNSNLYMLGTRFGDLDYYLFLGEDLKNILNSFTVIVDRLSLKPRYVLGYHQACYGYENRSDLEWVVRKYRENEIPLDGLGIDVDLQRNYRTFTIDTENFPDPEGMFSDLRSQGVKCCANITPLISNQDKWGNPDDYSSYKEGIEKGYFVMDRRYDADNSQSKEYQLYCNGNEVCANEHRGQEPEGYNRGEPYIGEVYYGNNLQGEELGTVGHYPDLGRPEVREWWGKQYQYLYEMGLEFVWQDMTTPAIRDFRGDMKGFPFKLYVTSELKPGNPKLEPALKVWNLYSYNLHKATYEGLNKLHELSDKLKWRENKRNFIIGRGSYLGSHRFAGLWMGDNCSDWDFLQMSISQVLSLGMSTLAVTGQDIGGFETANSDNGKWASPELMIRWTVAGAFLPWFRNHYVRKGRKEFQEPFMYTEWFGGSENTPEPKDLYNMVLPICKHYIRLRYQLMQLFYDALFENILNGLPICRALFLNDPQDQALYNDKEEFLNDEFFVRKDLLVAPVLRPQSEDHNGGKRDIYLPAGSDWYHFTNNSMPLGSAYEGGSMIHEFDANINTDGNQIHFIVPLFVRAGAIIPTIEVEQYVGELNAKGLPNPITLNIYPGKEGKYTMYLDDGVSRSSAPKAKVDDPMANDEYRETQITHSYIADRKREIKIDRRHDNYKPFEEYFFVAVLHDPNEKQGAYSPLTRVTVNGEYLQAIADDSMEERADALSSSSSNAWYYNETINTSFIKVFDNSPWICIQAEYTALCAKKNPSLENREGLR